MITILFHAGIQAFVEYLSGHVLACLIPAFFIAGAIGVFVSQASVIKYFGAGARKILSYSVASISGSVLTVCSCTVLPLFSGIYTRGAGIGPATAFLYSGPAINILAIVYTARLLGYDLGVARAIGAVGFAFVIGLAMASIFRREETEKPEGNILAGLDAGGKSSRSSPSSWPFLSLPPINTGPHRALPVGFGYEPLHLVQPGGNQRMDDHYMRVRDTDRPVALRRYLRGRDDPGTPAAAHCPGMGWRKRSSGQSARLGLWFSHVLCHPDRGSHPEGFSQSGHGQGAGPSPAPCRPGSEPPQYAGHSQCHGNEEDTLVRRTRDNNGHGFRDGIWKVLCVIPEVGRDEPWKVRKIFLESHKTCRPGKTLKTSGKGG